MGEMVQPSHNNVLCTPLAPGILFRPREAPGMQSTLGIVNPPALVSDGLGGIV